MKKSTYCACLALALALPACAADDSEGPMADGDQAEPEGHVDANEDVSDVAVNKTATEDGVGVVQQAVSVSWSSAGSGLGGVAGSGSYYFYRNSSGDYRVRVQGTVKDTASDGRSGCLKIRFNGGGFQNRTERVCAGGFGVTTSFDFNSTYTNHLFVTEETRNSSSTTAGAQITIF
jgi:hypothetical protein